jgi:hypothetical protein
MAIVLALVIFTFGMIQSVRYYRSEKDGEKLNFLRLHFFVVALSALLFFPVAKELDVRFYIVIIFFPFMLFGIAIKYFEEKSKKLFFMTLMATVTIVLIISNASMYKLAYDFSTIEGKSEIYGGISLKEAKNISGYISGYLKKSTSGPGTAYLFPFEYSRSLGYFIKKDGFDYFVLADDNYSGSNLIFLIGKSKNKERILEDNKKTFQIIELKEMGRFSVFVLQKQERADEKE